MVIPYDGKWRVTVTVINREAAPLNLKIWVWLSLATEQLITPGLITTISCTRLMTRNDQVWLELNGLILLEFKLEWADERSSY